MARYLPLLLLVAVFVGMIVFTRRNRQRAALAASERKQRLTPGVRVMTTSGLYATVVSVNDDDTALLAIAAGVEVKWTVAALREVTELPDQYRGAFGAASPPAQGDGSAAG